MDCDLNPDAEISEPETSEIILVVESSAELTSEDEESETFRKTEFRWKNRRMPPIDATFKETASGSSCVLIEPVQYFRQTFLGALLKMGLVPKPQYSMYWSTELRCDAIADAMSRNRFREVLRYLHFNDNSEAVLDRESPHYDRLFKIRPLIESIRRNELKQYIPKKPKKWGIKVNARTGMSGLLYDFCFYEGIHTIGTIRRNRLKNAPLKTEKELKRAGRGAFHVCTTAENNLCIVRWHDSAVVDLSSTYVCTQPVCKLKRWNKKQKTLVDVSCPAIVKEYNKYMDGVDLAGMLRALYQIDHRIVNGWLQYKRDLKTSDATSGSQKDLMQFTLDVAEAMTKVNKAYARKSRGRVSVTAEQAEIINQKNRCRNCRKTSRVRCQMQHSSCQEAPMDAADMVKRLIIPWCRKGRNITMYNFFTSIPLAEDLLAKTPQEGYVVSVGSPDPHGDLQSSAQQFRAQRILNFPFEQHPVGILKTPQPIMYSDSVKPMCIAEAPLPDEHVCILGVVTKGGLMTLRHVQMLYESDCEELAQGLSSYLCAKVKEIDAEVGETFGLDPSLDIYPFVAPLEFDISGVQSGSLETPLFCLTNEHPTWSVYGFAMNAYDVTDPESPILFSDVSSDLKAIKQHSDVTYQEWKSMILEVSKITFAGFASIPLRGHVRFFASGRKTVKDDTALEPPSSLLPLNGLVFELIVRLAHESELHTRLNQILAALRRRFWVVRGRQAVKRCIRACIIFQKHDVRRFCPLMSDLPPERVTSTFPFNRVGLDFAGPLYVKDEQQPAQKAYICLFTCIVTRAVHLEVVFDMTTKYSTDRAPWCGGYCERLVKSKKNALRKVLGRALLRSWELHTVLYENGISPDFRIGADERTRLAQAIQQLLMKHLWNRWLEEYLVTLTSRGKCTKIRRQPEKET
ncbi:PiggyBac transposable element-derived protein 3 [Trichinella sp. T9]|nr:PiggyBac transposable element-derived protein 3 [Trichinella sp. T9]